MKTKNKVTFKLKTRRTVIPLHIYQVWHDLKEMPTSVKESIELIKEQNPEFEHHLYDEVMCRKFIQDNFPKKVVDAYDSIVPHAIKADLWRYCIMYKMGGIYLDSKYYGIDGFKFITLTSKEYFCSDIPKSGSGIYNAILICKPKNKIMLKSIHGVVKNVENNYYGSSPLSIGPLMMKTFFSPNDKIELKHTYTNIIKRYINYKGHRILKYNEKYQKEKAQQLNHWVVYWKSKNLYK
jgi:hypothetical protein